MKPSGSEEERGFQVLLEVVEGKVDVFGDQVISLGQKIDKMADEVRQSSFGNQHPGKIISRLAEDTVQTLHG